ncbi:MAG TPA: tetratricopeptide repeat protein [Bryobacteraceae bacterium]|jgi:tetratricopeptide (TPR) repeat protein|nr:tetratricopeptide repeat protein [Bryobacteraceae bacterium]
MLQASRIFKAAAVILGATTFAAQAQTVDHAAAYYHYSLGHMYADLASINGSPDYIKKAIENYKLAIKEDPQTPMLGEELSELYIQTGRLREAQSDAEEALKANPNDVNAHRMLGRIFTRQIGDQQEHRIDDAMLKKSIEEYKKITELDPKDVDSWLMLGRLHKVAQNSVDAQNAYKKALEVDPDSEDALTGLAMVYADLGDNTAAADLLKKLASKNPTPRSLQALAAAYEQMHEYALAAETLKRTLELNPPNAAEIKRFMAADLRRAGQFQAALKVYQDLVAEEPSDAESYLRMSNIYTQLRDFAKAREAEDKARAIEPNNLDVRYNEVTILESEGKTTEAIVRLKEILDTTAKKNYSKDEKGNRIELLDRLWTMYRLNDQTEPAVETLRQIAELDHERDAAVEALIIDTYRIGKDLPKAQKEADAAVKRWPEDRTLHVAHATVLGDSGQTDAAAAELKKLLDGKNDREIYLDLAAYVYDRVRKFDEEAKALDAADKLSVSKEDREAVWFQRGAMYEKMKKIDLAEAEFRKILEINPDSAATMNYLGYMLADRNVKLAEALSLITKALDKEPNNGAYLDSLGWVYFKMNRLQEAEENLRQALIRTPRDGTVHDHMGDVLLKESKVREAIAQWQLSLQEFEKASPADVEPGDIAKVKSKLEAARVRLAKEGNPKN